jgi:peptidyl-prolyl cis-trans isomerase B (cyclophilin B)
MERGATSAADLGTLRVAARSANGDLARLALRSLGQLERSTLIPDLLPGLRHALPEVRVEAANAIAQAAIGFPETTPRGAANTLQSAHAALNARLGVEADSAGRAALREAIARLPYRDAADVDRAEQAILSPGDSADVNDRLGTARALEILVRQHQQLHPASPPVIAALRELATAPDNPDAAARDVRVRRLALEALTTLHDLDPMLVDAARGDPDAQARRLAIRAIASGGGKYEQIEYALTDPAPMVRLEALRAIGRGGGPRGCRASLSATFDEELLVSLTAIDQLSLCGDVVEATERLERMIADDGEINEPRGWHRAAHALLALTASHADRAAPWMRRFAAASLWQVRLAAVRGARQANDNAILHQLAEDADDRVANGAQLALGMPAKSSADAGPELDPVSAADLRKYAAPRARITIKDVGRFEVALFTAEAPLTEMHFIKLAEAGYYNGTAIDTLTPNATLAAGYRAAGAAYPRREVGIWPNVRGTLAIGDPAEARFLVNLVDNPQFDHQYTVFAQVLNGADVVDRILEGDLIESIEILP